MLRSNYTGLSNANKPIQICQCITLRKNRIINSNFEVFFCIKIKKPFNFKQSAHLFFIFAFNLFESFFLLSSMLIFQRVEVFFKTNVNIIVIKYIYNLILVRYPSPNRPSTRRSQKEN